MKVYSPFNSDMKHESMLVTCLLNSEWQPSSTETSVSLAVQLERRGSKEKDTGGGGTTKRRNGLQERDNIYEIRGAELVMSLGHRDIVKVKVGVIEMSGEGGEKTLFRRGKALIADAPLYHSHVLV